MKWETIPSVNSTRQILGKVQHTIPGPSHEVLLPRAVAVIMALEELPDGSLATNNFRVELETTEQQRSRQDRLRRHGGFALAPRCEE